MKKRSRGGGVRLLPKVPTTIVGEANSNSGEQKIYKLYEVIFIDEYDNFTNLGFFKNLNDPIEDLNSFLSSYGNGQYKLKEGEVSEYNSTLNSCFDLDVIEHFSEEYGEEAIEDLRGVSIRGFIYELTQSDFEQLCKIFCIE